MNRQLGALVDSRKSIPDRRKALRFRFDAVLRWKRPGKAEDHKAWSVDHSDGGIGFCTLVTSCPGVGEVIHLRVFDHDRWMTVEKTVRVVRTDPMPGGQLVLVGCAWEPEGALNSAIIGGANLTGSV